MKAETYRLGEYKIIESDTGQLTWEGHFGFGDFKIGRCFTKGSILFIGPPEKYQNGFLKGEFLDDLQKYPRWGKTTFYCIGVGVHHCNSGKRLTKEELMMWTIVRSPVEGSEMHRDASQIFSNNAATGMVMESSVCRLHRHEIVVRTDGKIVSRTYTGLNSVKSGNCFVLEDILFIDPPQKEPLNLNKRQFLVKLRQLPRWDKTLYFSERFSLHECKSGIRIQGERKRLPWGENAKKKYDTENDWKTNSEVNISNGSNPEAFPARLSAVLDSFAGLGGSQCKRTQFFRFIRSHISKSIAIFRDSGIWIMKKITRMIAIVFFIIASLYDFFISYVKKHHD